MEAIQDCLSQVKAGSLAIIEWRSSATALYLISLNTAFWLSVFYLDRTLQYQILISLASCIFSWDVLLTSSNNRSILMHIISWPFHNLFRTFGVASALFSAQCLNQKEEERACWLAYGTVLLLLISPAWRYQRCNEKILHCISLIIHALKRFSIRFAVTPLSVIFKLLTYIILFRWVPAFCHLLLFYAIVIRDRIIKVFNALALSVRNFFHRLTQGILYIFTRIRNFFHRLTQRILYIFSRIRIFIVQSVVFVYTSIINAVISFKNYLVDSVKRIGLFTLSVFRSVGKCVSQKLSLLKDFIIAKLKDLWMWIREKIFLRIKETVITVAEWLRYYLCAHWWPDLKVYLTEKIGKPLQRIFNYFCYGLVYIFCGHWISPLLEMLKKHFGLLGRYVYDKFIVPFIRLTRKVIDYTIDQLKIILRHLAIAIRDSILWPIFLAFLQALKMLGAKLYSIFVQPCVDYIYAKYKRCEDIVLIYFLGPFCEVVVNNIPEKSPFCDDSDTELAGLLPSDEVEGITSSSSSSSLEDISDHSISRSRSLTSSTEDEKDFAKGLKFPTVEVADELSEDNSELADVQRDSEMNNLEQLADLLEVENQC